MTERIEKLFEQALEEFKAENKYVTIIVPNPLKEKFAELIVKECNNLNKQVITQCNLEHYLVFDRIVNKYQEHFGVKL